MNKKFYKDITYVIKPHDVLVLVNKNNKLPSGFIPDNLVAIDLKYANADRLVREEAKINFERLCYDAQKLGHTIIAISAFRDFDYQNQLYNHYVEKKGQEYADLASADLDIPNTKLD